MTTAAEIEELITPLLDRDAQLSVDACDLVDEFLDSDCTFGTVPDAAVYRLHLVATSTYRAGLLCLRTPETAFNAYSLLRDLLESWSHLEFIADVAGGGNFACRALRYELGAIREWSNTLHAALSYFDKETWLVTHDQKQRDLERLWNELHCSGALRSYSHATRTLEGLTSRPNMEWVLGVWRATSATVHMYAVDFVFATEPCRCAFRLFAPRRRASACCEQYMAPGW